MALNEIDEIKELFQNELGNYQAKVDPNLWNGIQAGLGGAGAAAGVGTSLSLFAKISIGIGVAAAVVGTVLVVNNQQKQDGDKHEVVKTTPIQEATEENAESEELAEELEQTKAPITYENTDALTTEEVEENPIYLPEENSVEAPAIVEVPTYNSPQPTNGQEANSTDKGSVNNSTINESTTTTIQGNNKAQDEEESNSLKESITAVESALDLVTANIIERDNQYIKFSAQPIPSGATVIWDFGDGRYDYEENPIHFFEESGTYNVSLTVKQEGQSVTREIPITIQVKGSLGELPNAFTPNGDGRNDELFIESEHLKTFQLTVMDRNQNVVYTTNDPNFKWDGIDQKGAPVSDGEYIYIVVAEDEAGNMINKYQQLTIRR